MDRKRNLLVVVALVILIWTDWVMGYKAGDYVVWEYAGYQMRTNIEKHKQKVNGYTVVWMIGEDDPYGGGSYWADVPGVGWANIGADSHDAMTGESMGVRINSEPIPMNGGIEYGAPVGTKVEVRGYSAMEGEDPEDFERAVWELISYEPVSVPYGDFSSAMKVLYKEYNYYGYGYGYENLDNIPENQWELSESCSDYSWIVPVVGAVQMADYEYYGEPGPYPVQLVKCKIDGKTNPSVVVTGPPEMEVSLAGTKIPLSVISGIETNLTLAAVIENVGDGSCPKGTSVDVVIYAVNTGTSDQIEIGRADGQSISMLKPGMSKQVKVKALLPEDLAEGVYELKVVIDDKEALYGTPINVAEGSVELAMALKAAKVPSAIIAGTSVKSSIDLNITNNGNLTTDKNAVGTLEVYAYSLNDGTQYPLMTVAVKLGNLKPGKTKPAKLPIVFPDDLPEDTYGIIVYLDDDSLIIDGVAIAVSEPFVDLEMTLVRSTLPPSIIAGTSVKSSIEFLVSNKGNVSTDNTAMATFEVRARSLTDGTEYPLAEVEVKMNNLAPSKSKKVKLSGIIPVDLPAGNYQVVIYFEDQELIINGPITPHLPYVDLAMTLSKSTIPLAIIAGSDVDGVVELNVTNQGNIPTGKTDVFQFDVCARATSDGTETALTTIDEKLSNLKPGKGKPVKIPVTFPASIPEGSYQVVIYNGDVEIVVASVDISEPFIELSGAIDELKSSSIVIAGESGRIEVVLELTNSGNDTIGKSQAIDIDVYGQPEGGEKTLLGTATGQDIGGLAPGKSTKITLEMAIPSELEFGSYQISLHIDSGNAIPEDNEDDNWVVMQSDLNMNIVSSFADIMMPAMNGNKEYSTFVKGDFFQESGKGSISGVFNETVELLDDNYTNEGTQEYGLNWLNDGTYITNYNWRYNGSWERYSFDLNDSGVLMPDELTLKNKVKSSSTGYGHHRLYGMDFDFDGTLESECEIVGIETVKANDVSYEAFKIEWSFGIKGDGVLDLTAYGEKAYNFTHTLHQDITYWAVPGIGVVKSSTKINVKLKANGMGSEIWTSSYVKELIP